jgi:hypothetical protein
MPMCKRRDGRRMGLVLVWFDKYIKVDAWMASRWVNVVFVGGECGIPSLGCNLWWCDVTYSQLGDLLRETGGNPVLGLWLLECTERDFCVQCFDIHGIVISERL